jgi:superfamily II DNA or RNA helicase
MPFCGRDICLHGNARLLRPYQSELLHNLLCQPSRCVLLQLACGGGKTFLAAEWAKRCNPTPDRPLWFVVHRRELLEQTREEFVKHGFSPGIVAAGEELTPDASVQLAMIFTLNRRFLGTALPPPGFVIVDEAHHCAARSYQTLRRDFPKACILGLSATPSRLDGKPLGKFFNELVCGLPTAELIEQGWLSDYSYHIGVMPDLEDLTVLSGDYEAGQAGELALRTLLVAKPWEEHARWKIEGPSYSAPPLKAHNARPNFSQRMGLHASTLTGTRRMPSASGQSRTWYQARCAPYRQ